jgi:hypothetical protein
MASGWARWQLQPSQRGKEEEDRMSETSKSAGHGREEDAIAEISRAALIEWKKALRGALAVPAALALTWASSAMYLALFLERGLGLGGGPEEAHEGEVDAPTWQMQPRPAERWKEPGPRA